MSDNYIPEDMVVRLKEIQVKAKDRIWDSCDYEGHISAVTLSQVLADIADEVYGIGFQAGYDLGDSDGREYS